jgi:hypothetical protein
MDIMLSGWEVGMAINQWGSLVAGFGLFVAGLAICSVTGGRKFWSQKSSVRPR